jgi:hypothetical protein
MFFNAAAPREADHFAGFFLEARSRWSDKAFRNAG